METSKPTPQSETAPVELLPNGEALLVRREAIVSAMQASQTPAERAAVKDDIVALFRDVDAAVKDYCTFKESVKALATQWKDAERASQSTGDSNTQRVDHLGASTFVEKGWSMISTGDGAGAERALRRALELVPAANEAETLLGWSQMLQERYDDALLTFHNVLMREPRYALARANVGFVCLRKKIYGEAIEHLASAIKLNSDTKATLYAHLYMGLVYYEREMVDDAEAFFRKALELGPNLVQSWYELGRALWFAERPDGAKEAWRTGASVNKFNPWAKRCAEVLVLVESGGAPPR